MEPNPSLASELGRPVRASRREPDQALGPHLAHSIAQSSKEGRSHVPRMWLTSWGAEHFQGLLCRALSGPSVRAPKGISQHGARESPEPGDYQTGRHWE